MVKEAAVKKKPSEFSERLMRAREGKGLSQAKLAQDADLSPTLISEYENGKKQPTISSAARLAAALDVSLDYLCGFGPHSIYERNPVLAWYRAIKDLRMDIESVSDSEIVLTFKEIMDTKNGIEISGREIRRFFEEYKKLQMVIDAYAGIPGGDTIIETAENHLLDRFKNLPKLPPYNMVKHEKD